MKEELKILVIDDDDEFRATLADLLKDEGYLVEEAKDGKSAVKLAEERIFDLIVADVRLPGGVDGVEAVMKIKQLRPNVKTLAIIITGYADQEAPIRAIKVGVDDYIYKPFELSYFLHTVKRVLKIHQMEKQEREYLEEIKAMKDELEEHNLKLAEEVKERTKELTLLFELGREITSSLKLEEVLGIVVDRVSNVLGAEKCAILLFDERSGELFIGAARGISGGDIRSTRVKIGEMISGWVLKEKEPFLSKDIRKDARMGQSSKEGYYSGCFMSVPMVLKGKEVGVINISGRRMKGCFTKEDLALVEGIADQASIAIENARLHSNLERVYLQIMVAINSIIELKDNYTCQHSERVTKYAVALGEEMGLSPHEIDVLRAACQLHDLGKIGVPEYILTKPGKLTQEEWQAIKLHPQRGAEIISPLYFLNDAVRLIEEHHERFDGKGYPFGKKGKEISLGARIIAVADSFDAMTTERPYKKALSIEEAKEELIRNSGSQFDPEIVRAFIKLIERKPEFFRK